MRSTLGRAKSSNWILLIFLSIILLSALYSEIFQAPQKSLEGLALYNNPLTTHILDQIKGISFSNRLGKIKLVQKKEIWYLVAPRKLYASIQTIGKIKHALQSIKIRKLFPFDPINQKSFSLDHPILKIILTLMDDKKIEFSLGIINPVDNSAYIALTDKKIIYQVDLLANSLETLDITDFIESKIFSLTLNDLTKVTIFKGKNDSTPHVSFRKKNDLWYQGKGASAISTKTYKRVHNLLNIKSSMILDQIPVSIEKKIKSYVDSPQYTIRVIGPKGDIISYTVSATIKPIPSLKIGKKQSIIVTASNRQYPFIVDKSYLKKLSAIR